MQTKLKSISFFVLGALLVLGGVILAGSLTPSGNTSTPTFYTLSDIYNKLNLNTYSASTHTVSTTSLPTTSTMHTLTEIWDKIPVIDYSQILDTYSIMGATGTIAVKTNDTAVVTTSTTTNKLLLTVPVGYYSGSATVSTTSTAFDAANIKSGTNLFGITGAMSAGTPATVWSANMTGGASHIWQEGIDYCAGTVDGTTGWHLPFLWELLKYYQQNGTGDFQSDSYWSSTEYVVDLNSAWAVNMLDGNIAHLTKDFPFNYVRCAK